MRFYNIKIKVSAYIPTGYKSKFKSMMRKFIR
jgi:hypothetical protein